MKHVLLLALGLLGLIELLVPKLVVRVFTAVAYRNTDDIEPRGWFHVLARLEGALLVFVALVGLYRTTTAAKQAAAVPAADHEANSSEAQ